MEHLLRRTLLAAWAVWFAIVTASNMGDLLKSFGFVGQGFWFTSNNLELISRATGAGVGFNRFLFVGVILWEAAASSALAWAFLRRPGSLLPFYIAMTLFLAFMIGDEITRTYGPQGMHIRIFVALGMSVWLTRLEVRRE
jgi:hypothetical protein